MLIRQLQRSERAEFSVREAQTCAAGLEALAEETFDCVLLDYSLPGNDGIAFLDELGGDDGRLPCTVVMITGQGNEQIAVEALKRGIEDYVVKDMLASELLERTVLGSVTRRALRERVREHEQELRMFLERAAHDLRSPARHIGLLAEMLQDRAARGDREGVDEGLRLIARSSRHLDRLIRGVRGFNVASRQRVEAAEIALGELVDDVREVLSKEIEEAGARIEAEALPRVHADPDGMALVLQNLTANAIKFRGAAAPVVRITAHESAEGWHVTVCDNGIGVHPDEREQIFTPFVRGSEHGSYEGSGLGLATCRQVVAAHGGEIWVDPEVDAGTTIHFTLPRPAAD